MFNYWPQKQYILYKKIRIESYLEKEKDKKYRMCNFNFSHYIIIEE